MRQVNTALTHFQHLGPHSRAAELLRVHGQERIHHGIDFLRSQRQPHGRLHIAHDVVEQIGLGPVPQVELGLALHAGNLDDVINGLERLLLATEQRQHVVVELLVGLQYRLGANRVNICHLNGITEQRLRLGLDAAQRCQPVRVISNGVGLGPVEALRFLHELQIALEQGHEHGVLIQHGRVVWLARGRILENIVDYPLDTFNRHGPGFVPGPLSPCLCNAREVLAGRRIDDRFRHFIGVIADVLQGFLAVGLCCNAESLGVFRKPIVIFGQTFCRLRPQLVQKPFLEQRVVMLGVDRRELGIAHLGR